MANFSDTFTDTDSTLLSAHTPTVGTSWTKVAGSSASADFQILSDQADVTANVINAHVTYVANPSQATANYTVQATVIWGAQVTEGQLGIIGRFTDTSNFYAIRVNIDTDTAGDHNYTLMKCVGGSFTVLHGPTGTPATGDVIALDMQGSTIRWLLNSVEQGSVTDSSLSSAGQGGIFTGGLVPAESGGTTRIRDTYKVDTFSITEAAAGGVPRNNLMLLGAGA